MSEAKDKKSSVEDRVARNVAGKDPNICGCGHDKKAHQMLGAPTGCVKSGCKCKGFRGKVSQ